MTRDTHAILLGAGLLAAAAALPGCRGDRSDSPPRQFFPDGRQMRPSAAGTVAFGQSTDAEDPGRDRYLKDNTAFYFGKAINTPDQPYVRDIPVPVTMAMINRGKERFNIYCSVCHGYDGKGKGMVGDTARRTGWSYALPNFHDETGKYTDKTQPTAQDGYIFHVIRYGVLNPDGSWKMPPYGHAVSEADAWAIVSYIRTLQAAYAGKPEDVPESELDRLRRTRPTGASPAPAQPAAAGKGGA